MRQRKPKDLEAKLNSYSDLMMPAEGPYDLSGFDGKVYLEIGCGKGDFIVKKAGKNPENQYIAIEGQDAVILRALEKARDQELNNVHFTMEYVNQMSDFFAENSLDGVYLNFSDPWPKARHAKRRLTYHERLKDYEWAIKPGGFIEFKTDNEGLFEFTLEEIPQADLEISAMTRDLHGDLSVGNFTPDQLAILTESADTMTEYETKFSSKGKNINFVRCEIDK